MTSLAFLTRGAVGDSRSTRQEHHFGASSSRGPQRDRHTEAARAVGSSPTSAYADDAGSPSSPTSNSDLLTFQASRRYRRASSVSWLAIYPKSASAVLGAVIPALRQRTTRSVLPRTVEQVTNSLTAKPAGAGDGTSPSPHGSKTNSMFRAQVHRDSGAALEPIPTPPRSRETQPPRCYT